MTITTTVSSMLYLAFFVCFCETNILARLTIRFPRE